VGGSERWESKAAIGYKGYAANPLQPTLINRADPNQPIYDSDNWYTDLWIGYTHKLYSGKVLMRLQLNCNDVFESGHLQPIAVNYDGTPWAFRIVDSRQFIFTAGFDF